MMGPEAMRALIVITWACLATSSVLAQPGDPRRAFTEALGRFSVAMSGRYADDGTRITTSLPAVADALAKWDESVRRTRASASDGQKSPGPGGARLRVATALVLAERGLIKEAVEQLDEAIKQAPREIDAHTVLGHQEAVDRLQAAAGLGASDDVYRHLADAYEGLGKAEESRRAREVWARILRDRLRRAGFQ